MRVIFYRITNDILDRKEIRRIKPVDPEHCTIKRNLITALDS